MLEQLALLRRIRSRAEDDLALGRGHARLQRHGQLGRAQIVKLSRDPGQELALADAG
jgi:hypothetical protein